MEEVEAEPEEQETVMVRAVPLGLRWVEEVVVLVEVMEPRKMDEKAAAVEVQKGPMSKMASDCLVEEEVSCLLEVEDAVCGYLLCFASWQETTCWPYYEASAGLVLKVLLHLEVSVLTWLVVLALNSARIRGRKGTRSLGLLLYQLQRPSFVISASRQQRDHRAVVHRP